MKTKLSYQKKRKKKSIEAPTTAKMRRPPSHTVPGMVNVVFSFLMITPQFFQNESINRRLEGHKQY